MAEIQREAAARLPLLEGLEDAHPVEYYQRALEVFNEGRQEEGVFLFYLGQLRYRTHLTARRGEEETEDDVKVFGVLSQTVGMHINAWAGGDVLRWQRAIEVVLAFDAANPDRFTPPDQFPEAHREVRDGLAEMARGLPGRADEIRRERTERGLENRT
jgi:hypothetical protein